MTSGTPPKNSRAWQWAGVQEVKSCDQLASALGVVASPEHGHENLGLTDLAGSLVDDVNRLASIVDEHLLAGAVALGA